MKKSLVWSFCASALIISAAAQAAVPGPTAKVLNPDISLNFLGLGQYGSSYSSDRTASQRNGLKLQEAEIQFFSDVDPYLRASALFSLAQEDGSADFGIDPEEVFIETISLPVVAFRAGKFRMALGRHNQLHTHAFPFIDAPLINQRLLGDEGLNEAAISAAVLIPAPWFSEVTLQALALSNENLFNSRNSGDMGGLVGFTNLWDLNDNLSMELGLSGVMGVNQFKRNSSVLDSYLTFKWRPAEGGKYQALSWSTEYLLGQRPGLTQDRSDTDPITGQPVTVQDSLEKLGGIASWLQYQFAQRWWIQGRYEYLGLARSPAISIVTKQSALLSFLPSEFSGLRMQYDWIQDSARPKNDYAVALQYNITIGAHPAHKY